MQGSAPLQRAQGRRGGVLLEQETAGARRGVPRGPCRGSQDEVDCRSQRTAVPSFFALLFLLFSSPLKAA